MDKFDNSFWKAVVAKVANTENGEIKEIIARDAWDANDSSLIDDDELFTDDFKSFFKTMLDRTNRRMKGEVSAETIIYPNYAAPDAETQPPTPSESHAAFIHKMAESVKTNKRRGEENFLTKKAAEVQLQLPMVADEERAAGNIWLRSALFSVSRPKRSTDRNKAEIVKNLPIPSPWASIKYSGEILTQNDLDLLLELIHRASSVGTESPIPFTENGLLRAMNWSYGTHSLAQLDESAGRLMGAVISIEDENIEAKFHLLQSYVRDKTSGVRHFVIDKTAAKFFTSGFTAINYSARLKLRTSLSKWLHGFIASQPHTKHGVYLKNLMKWSGSSRSEKKFKSDMKDAIVDLLKISDEHLGISKIEITDGKEGPILLWECYPNRKMSLKNQRIDP